MKQILSNFQISGEYVSSNPYGEGHINETYVAYFNNHDNVYRVLVQKINHRIFTDIEGLMNNITYVTSYLSNKITESNSNPNKETLNVIKTIDNKNYYYDQQKNEYYRVYVFIEDTVTYQQVINNEVFYECGKSFGKFQKLLSGADATKIKDVIADFHNTPIRYQNLLKAVNENKANRLHNVTNEVEFYKARHNEYSKVTDLIKSGDIPLRITHNDTKLNNILMDPQTNKGVCIIDLDTIMQGSLLYDIGDSLRFGCNTGLEDEPNLDLVNFDIQKFESYIKGFIEETKDSLTQAEINNLAFSGKLMTLECGMRFLTDYLNGDTYFRVHRENHNLDRTRTQIKLVSDMEKLYNQLINIVKKYV